MRDPSTFLALFSAADEPAREAAWRQFVDAHSRLLIHTARAVFRDRDEAMDAYTHVLGELRANDFARLRSFAHDGRSKLTTWLVVVARRLCIDYQRQRFGRVRPEQSESAQNDQLLRRRLGRMAGEDLEHVELAAAVIPVDEMLDADEVRAALVDALGTLAPVDRVLLALRFDDDRSAQQIARILHFPTPFHVYRRLDVVMKSLRRLLQARGVERTNT